MEAGGLDLIYPFCSFDSQAVKAHANAAPPLVTTPSQVASSKCNNFLPSLYVWPAVRVCSVQVFSLAGI